MFVFILSSLVYDTYTRARINVFHQYVRSLVSMRHQFIREYEFYVRFRFCKTTFANYADIS